MIIWSGKWEYSIMKLKVCHYLFFTVFFLRIINDVSAQTIGAISTPGTLNLGGGTAKINQNFLVDWSIGESAVVESFFGRNSIDFSMFFRPKFFVTSGVLQPIDWVNLPILNSENLLLDEVRVFPVPAGYEVNLDFRSGDIGYFSVSLYSSDGKIIDTKDFIKTEKHYSQKWNISMLASGSYYFKVLVKANSYKIEKTGVFKFQKIN